MLNRFHNDLGDILKFKRKKFRNFFWKLKLFFTLNMVSFLENDCVRLLKPWRKTSYWKASLFFQTLLTLSEKNESHITWGLVAKIATCATVALHWVSSLELFNVFQFRSVYLLAFLECFSHCKSQCGKEFSFLNQELFFFDNFQSVCKTPLQKIVITLECYKPKSEII